MYCVLGLLIAFGAGFITCYFVMRNNKKYFDIDEMLKAKRDQLVVFAKDGVREQLDELKQKIDDALKLN